MTIMKTLPMMEKPVKELHELMEKQGFSRQQREGEWQYTIQIHDASSASLYRLVIPLKKQQHNQLDAIYFGQAYVLNDANSQVDLTDAVREAARSKLAEVADYLKSNQQITEKKHELDVMNGSMATTMEDMVSLGKEMDSMYTNQELMKKGQIPDPIQ